MAGLIGIVINVLIWLIIIDVVLSWVADPRSSFAVTLRHITDPILAPIRRLVPPQKTGGLDISPLIAIILLQILLAIVYRVL